MCLLPRYTGPEGDLAAVQAWLAALFRSHCPGELYHHYTTAVDTANISHVFNDVQDILMQRMLLRLAHRGPPFPAELEAYVPWRLRGDVARRAAIAEHIEPLTRWSYLRIAELSEEHGAIPLLAFLRLPNSPRCTNPGPSDIVAWAQDAGLETLRLRGLYVGHDQAALSLEGVHPTAEAHRMIAEQLAPELSPWLARARQPSP